VRLCGADVLGNVNSDDAHCQSPHLDRACIAVKCRVQQAAPYKKHLACAGRSCLHSRLADAASSAPRDCDTDISSTVCDRFPAPPPTRCACGRLEAFHSVASATIERLRSLTRCSWVCSVICFTFRDYSRPLLTSAKLSTLSFRAHDNSYRSTTCAHNVFASHPTLRPLPRAAYIRGSRNGPLPRPHKETAERKGR
jgi:hypothetical protein